MEADAEVIGRALDDDCYIFTSADGGPMKPHSVSPAWRRTARRLGYGNVRLHDARHTHASWLLAQGNADDLKLVSERLGHSSPTITLSIYAHLLPGRQRQAAIRFEEELARVEVSSGQDAPHPL